MSTYLTKHFTLEELTTTQVRNVDNFPTSKQIENLKRICQDGMEPIRAKFGPIHVNSGFRSLEVNTIIGGSSSSAHMKGLACDFVPLKKNITLKEIIFWIINKSNIKYDQVIAEYWRLNGGWIHIGFSENNKKPRNESLMIGQWTKEKYESYDPTKVPNL